MREQKQLHGIIVAVDEHVVTFERADGLGRFAIPFDGTLDAADPSAIYTLRGNGEAVSGINFTAAYTIALDTRG